MWSIKRQLRATCQRLTVTERCVRHWNDVNWSHVYLKKKKASNSHVESEFSPKKRRGPRSHCRAPHGCTCAPYVRVRLFWRVMSGRTNIQTWQKMTGVKRSRRSSLCQVAMLWDKSIQTLNCEVAAWPQQYNQQIQQDIWSVSWCFTSSQPWWHQEWNAHYDASSFAVTLTLGDK